MSSAVATWRCRGVRIWCDRRCEATTAVEPPAYPTGGFYCALHGYQKPRAAPDGALTFSDAVCEAHVRRRTSFVAPEATVAAEMAKSPGLVRERAAGGGKGGAAAAAAAAAGPAATGAALLEWLQSRRALPEDAARAFAGRMVALGVLAPLPGTPPPGAGDGPFNAGKDALYRVLPGGGGGGGGGGAATGGGPGGAAAR